MFNYAYESLLEPPRIHRLTPFLRVAAELPGEGDPGPAPALVAGMHILPAVVDNRRNHAGLEDVGAEDVQQAPAAGEAPAQRSVQIPGSGQVVVALDALGADHAVHQQLQVVLLGKGKCIVHNRLTCKVPWAVIRR